MIHHHMRVLVEDEELKIKWIPNLLMLADGLTKALLTSHFKRYQEKWGLVE